MASIWNYLSTLRTGHNYLARSGNEMFGTVIKHGVNQKTVTVRTSFHHWSTKYLRYFNKHSNVQVHDEVEACVTGDKVIIKLCEQLSKSKSYYVKRIVKPFGRDDYYTELRLEAQGNPNIFPKSDSVSPEVTERLSTLEAEIKSQNEVSSKTKEERMKDLEKKQKQQKANKTKALRK